MGETLALLARLPEAKILAGGQSLLPLMNLGLAQPGALVDVNGLPGLETVTEDGGCLRLGALVRHRTLETSPLIRRRCPALAEGASLIRSEERRVGKECRSRGAPDTSKQDSRTMK